MTRSPLARRYARALLELAQEQGRLDVVRQDLAGIAPLGKDRDPILQMLQGHTLHNKDRIRFWTALLEGRSDPLTLRFILFLIQKGRAAMLGDAIREFDSLCDEARGVLTVEIVSAQPLEASQLQAITDRFSEKLGRKVRAVTRVDAALLGGFQVRIDDLIYDYSVNHQLELAHRKMRTA